MARFKTSARTVDMLGRQQIAGIPTAINELFKNAHDAYADRAEVDYYRSDKLFALRDDGIGMTEPEFLSRWLTLGTASKLGAGGGLALPYLPPGKPERPLSGEKGIGRLSIAVLGPQVLVLTRAEREDDLHDLVVAYLHWGVFELPGLHLEDIVIPMRTFPAGTFPDKDDIRQMTETFATNLQGRNHPHNERKESILADLRAFDLDPGEIADYLPGSLDIRDGGTGTWFLIRPASDLLERDINGTDNDKDRATPIEKVLLGFTQTMTPGHPPPVLKTAFRDHAQSDLHADDRITEDAFFTPEEMKNADHRIWGEFDQYGQFRGTVSVYGEAHSDHIVSWRDGAGKLTRCGPFRIEMGTVQGDLRSTTLSLDEHARMVVKLNRMGGLYIYRDGVRILPYGDTDFDWLDIELRRTKSIGFYFFSHRRIFGVVSITRTNNPELQEKAGREGFRQNLAYRQLRSILKNFFIQIAADFFREESPHERFAEKRAELERLDEARRRREKQVSTKRGNLKINLEKFFRDYDDGQPEQEASHFKKRVAERLDTISKLEDPEVVAAELLDLEAEARRELQGLRERYSLTRPRGVGLSAKLEREWGNYRRDRETLEETVFQPVAEFIEGEVSARAREAAAHLDRRRRIQRVVEELEKEARKVTRAEKKATDEQMGQLTGEVRKATRESLRKIETVLRRAWDRFSRIDMDALPEEKAVGLRLSLESEIQQAKEREADYLQYLRAQLERINLDPEGFGSLDELEAMEQKATTLEEQVDMDLDLTQLGMALGIIEHEFNMNVKALRDSVRDLKAWADLNDGLKGLYEDFRSSFDHLDGYLALFRPLNRRLRRSKVAIHGNAIETFLGKLFGERCGRHEVEIKATRAFQKKTVITFPSSILPVFVNLTDNALFWLGEQKPPRIITLDAFDAGYLFSDNGKGIPERDREAVFEQGFSRKPGGRGLGLFISREVLRGIGFTLELLDTPGAGATFRIGQEETHKADEVPNSIDAS
uniref:histidine kinase n=1 Tax=Candidatus Kentrum sp. MB TaxID=2138164 RepID=A0A450XX45_9GAMM|nr:MAG: Histidine kinase-, DNA gyrase B-, and HSP90-like ATPase [Candidatus Kentron sp. MB]VFK33869.1 MAG: Histidine kinase-, DNA gyrase B-, and HSP90-like ATPase [Candidatus Kentron sp. MB]VFK76473.1 MAG: Histidine kinase-, DNA gyrase B-, and HSP90-like ATPase [Candidatus Kentron sp. MB]